MNVPRIASLTSIRGIAAWWVAFHNMRAYLPLAPDGLLAAAAQRGYLAVDLFFVLSGFVLQINYGRAMQNPSWTAIRAYAVARVARVYPLHLFMCAVFLLNPLVLRLHTGHWVHGVRYAWSYYFLSLLLIQNWGFTDQLGWNVPAWSISAELGAYLLFPLAAFIAARWLRNGMAVLIWVGVPLLLLAALFYAAGAGSTDDYIWRLGLPRCVLQFLAGLAIGQWFLNRGDPSLRLQATLLLLAGTLVAAWQYGDVPDYFCMPASFVMIVFALSAKRSPFTRVLDTPALVYLGTISYSTYLCHYFVRDWVGFLLVRPGIPVWTVCVVYPAAVFTASVLLHRWIELPGRIHVRRWALKRSVRPLHPVPASLGD
jgi:peptidoglycan/LPS O-acetylase OafA/YrhL